MYWCTAASALQTASADLINIKVDNHSRATRHNESNKNYIKLITRKKTKDIYTEVGKSDWGTIWHRTQFGTVPNLAPDPIWHRTNLAPRVQKSQFGTGPNLAPESIWHHAKGIHFITLYSRNMKVICNKYNFAILRNLFESFFKSSLQVKPQDMYPPQILAIKVQY